MPLVLGKPRTLLLFAYAHSDGAIFVAVVCNNKKQKENYGIRFAHGIFKSKSFKVRTLRDALYLSFRSKMELVIREKQWLKSYFISSPVDTRSVNNCYYLNFLKINFIFWFLPFNGNWIPHVYFLVIFQVDVKHSSILPSFTLYPMFRVFMMGSNNKCSIVEFGPNKSLFSSELSGGHFYLGAYSQISYKRFYVKCISCR